MAQKIKLVLKSLYVKKDGRFWGKARWVLDVKVSGTQIGDAKKRFTVTDGKVVKFPSNAWSVEKDVDLGTSLTVSFHSKEVATWFPDDFGSVTHTLKWPFRQSVLRLQNKYYRVTFDVLLEACGELKRWHNPTEVFACRGTVGNPKCVTVSGASHRARIEVCEVRPTPPLSYLPNRIGGTVVGKVTFKADKGKALSSLDPINVIPNPAVIPLLKAADASDKNAARIEVGYFEPRSLKLDATDKRLVWKIDSLDAKGKAKFLGSKNGLGVYVYGTAEGAVSLTLTFLGVKVAVYRAMIMKIRSIPCRVNLFDGGAGFQTTSSAADVVKHLKTANLILRQAGVELKLDGSNKTRDKAQKLQTGIFRVPLSRPIRGRARNLSGNFPRAARMNYRPEVLSLVYVVSMADADTLGEAVMMPFNTSPKPAGGSFPQLTDSGTPSASWISPSGVFPHGAAAAQTLEMMQQALHRFHKKAWAVTVCNGNSTEMQYANTLAHEVCHAMGLAHRESTQDLLPELNENLMHATEGPDVAQDLDIIQAKAIHKSPLVK